MTARGGPWRLTAGLLAYILWGGPLALVALTTAGAIWLGAVRSERRPATSVVVTAGLAAGAGVWWLLLTGASEGQLLRAWIVMATAALFGLAWAQPGPFLSRALGAVAFAIVGTGVLQLVVGPTWPDVIAEVERQLSVQWQATATMLGLETAEIETTAETMVPVLSGLFPAVLALQTVAGSALGWAVAHRLYPDALGTGLGTYGTFRFSDHFVWTVVLGLLGVLLPLPPAGGAVAANVLAFGSGLYMVRGLAILGRFMLAGGTSPLMMAVLGAFAVILALPMFIIMMGTWILGIADTWVDFRARLAVK